MYEKIKDVIDRFKDSQGNLSSDAFRKSLAEHITAEIDNSVDPSTNTNARESWVCNICDKNTYDVDWDYIGSGTNHLGCELQLAMENEACSTQNPKNWTGGS